jgi:hypothetical protein
MKIQKEYAALMQLCDAIELFHKERYISAITLAAASEEIFAQLLKQDSAKTKIAHSSAEELETTLFRANQDILGIRNYHYYRNKIKNELKHHGDEQNKETLNGDFRQVALNQIGGCIVNFKMIYKTLPKEKNIQDFCLEIGLS